MSKAKPPATDRREHEPNEHELPKGVICPRCECRHFRVYSTRERPGAIVRVRICRHCGKRVTTRETAE